MFSELLEVFPGGRIDVSISRQMDIIIFTIMEKTEAIRKFQKIETNIAANC